MHQSLKVDKIHHHKVSASYGTHRIFCCKIHKKMYCECESGLRNCIACPHCANESINLTGGTEKWNHLKVDPQPR